MDIHGVQSAVEGAYSALDGATPGSVRDTLSDAESKLEYIRFARNEGTQEVEADKVLRELEDTIKTYLE